jgi:hypothetical protein
MVRGKVMQCYECPRPACATYEFSGETLYYCRECHEDEMAKQCAVRLESAAAQYHFRWDEGE